MINKATIFFLILILCPQFIIGSKPLRFHHFTTEHGLPQNSPSAILQDNDGFIWISTENGVAKYDGLNFRVFRANPNDSLSLQASRVSKMHIDAFNQMWCSCYTAQMRHNYNVVLENEKVLTAQCYFGIDSLNQYNIQQVFCDSQDRNWLSIYHKQTHTGHTIRISNSIVDTSFNFIVGLIFEDSKGNIWILDRNTVFKIDTNDSITSIAYPKDVNFQSFLEDRNRRIYLCFSKGLYTVDENSNLIQLFKDELNDKVSSLFEDSEGGIWGNNGQNGFFRILNGKVKNWHFEKTVFQDGKFLNCAAENKGKVYLGTTGNGLYEFDLTNQSLYQYTHQKDDAFSISGNFVNCLFVDNQNNLWLSTLYNGICMANAQFNKVVDFSTYPNLPPDTLHQFRTFRITPNGNCWFGSDGSGIYEYSFEKGQLANYNHQLLSSVKTGVFEFVSDTAVWFGSREHGAFQFNTKNNTFKAFPFNTRNNEKHYWQNYVRDIHSTPNGLYFCTYSGLVNIDDNYQQTELTFDNYINPSQLWTNFSITEAGKNSYWLTTELGLAKIDAKGNVLKHYMYSENKNSISHNVVFCVLPVGDSLLWLGTYGGGLNKFNVHTEKFTNIVLSDEFVNDCIYSIIDDDAGNLWLAVNDGICCYCPQTQNVRFFDTDDGLASNGFGVNAVQRVGNNLYYGGGGSYCHFNPMELLQNGLNNEVVFTYFKVHGTDRNLKFWDTKRPFVMSHREKVFEVSYTVPEFFKPNDLIFAYRIRGLNKEWIQVGKDRSVILSNLPHGRYHFQVKVDNSDVIEEKIYEFPFTIKPPFWKTNVFNALMLALFLGILFLIYKYRISQLKKIEAIRIKIAQDLHDEIGSNLGSISIMSNSIKAGIVNDDQKGEYLDKISSISKKTADSMRDIIWFVSPANDNAQRITSRIREFINRTLPNIEPKILIDTTVFNDGLGLAVRRNIYLIIKEAVYNIAKYANATDVLCCVKKVKNELQLIVEDNGVGFENTIPKTGMGLKGMHKRAEEINAGIEIESIPGIGTKIKLKLSI